MPLCLNHCEIVLYADDTVIYISSSSVSVIESKLSDDLYNLSLWFSKNYLTLNILKSKFILTGSPQKLSSCQGINLVIDNLLLERSNTFKYLGVRINTNMKWSDHIEEISNKINQRLDLLKRIRYLLPLKTCITLYNSLY